MKPTSRIEKAAIIGFALAFVSLAVLFVLRIVPLFLMLGCDYVALYLMIAVIEMLAPG